MRQATWVFEHLAIALAVVAAIEVLAWWKSRRDPGSDLPSWTRGLRVVALVATLVVGVRVAMAAWVVVDQGSESRPFVAELARSVGDRLPKEAVLLFEGSNRGEHQLAMFLLDRTCYQLQGQPADEVARQVRDAGGLPYIVSANTAPWPRRFASKADPRALYEWQSPAVASKPVERPR